MLPFGEMVTVQSLHMSAGIVPARFVFSRLKILKLDSFFKPSTGSGPETSVFANLKTGKQKNTFL